MRHVACVHTLKQLHYESKTKVKCQAPAGLERSKIQRHGPGILRCLTKESENHTAFIKQLINTAIESAINMRRTRLKLHTSNFVSEKTIKSWKESYHWLVIISHGKDRKLKRSVCTEEKVNSVCALPKLYFRRHEKWIDHWKPVMSLIFSIVKKYRGWKYHWNFENQHWVKNQGVNTLWPKKLPGALNFKITQSWILY